MKKKWLVIVSMVVFICGFAAVAWANEPIKLVVNGQEIKPDVSPQIIGNRTMVPVRWIAEALGANVEWDAQTKTVLITTNNNPEKPDNSDQSTITKLVQDLGKNMKNVALLAPEELVSKSIQANYGNLVTPELLSQWQNNSSQAPGRVSSSPWPERIDIIKMDKLSDSQYQIKAEIIEVTSVEMSKGGYASKQPVTLQVEKINNNWLITAFKHTDSQYSNSMVYLNSEYGFSFELPASWSGYTIISRQWEGLAIGSANSLPAQTGVQLSIRHPQWTAGNPRQDIPIMVFTPGQWNSLQEGEFHIGAAPMNPSELGRSSSYIFALPARYNFAFPTGYEEVEQILENKPLKPLTEDTIPAELAKKIIQAQADKVIYALSTKDTAALANFTHPVKGVRFTPYTHVSPGQDIVFNQEALKSFFTDQKTYLWGYFDGTGEEIKLTPSQYYDRFIYEKNYITAEKVGYNEVLSTGNMLENQFEVYEDAIIVEYYFPGFNPDYAGMDWRSLRLVFEPYENDWKLVGIINNQWTV